MLKSVSADQLRAVLSGHQPEEVAGGFPDAAILVALTSSSDSPALILTQRTRHLTLHAGEVAFPGGKQDPEDASLLVTAMREAEEEIGLKPESFELLGMLDQRVTKTGIRMTPFVGIVSDEFEGDPNPGEIDSIFEVPLTFLASPDNLIVSRVERDGAILYVPQFNYGRYNIYGATAMVVVDLMNTVFEAQLPWSSLYRPPL